ncbi:lytic transglycosylase domain-containing protein [Bradyrhizobium sp. STM 3562]|uniref:lytic transglycosylase domain-containing protein n=1 Tax=Bradyrhizobium sp. STM 3562 TaxID=578924 RepID=UPI00388E2970
MVALIGPLALASDFGGDPRAVQQQPSSESRQPGDNQETKSNERPEQNAPSSAPGLCEVLATAATANDLPVDFFTRLIWQESRFKPDAISPKGAQGIAQFMPTTAKSSGLENPFDPLEAIAKSGELLAGLRREFGNLGLAAAAYNAGSGRVHDWLGGGRPLPQETRAYVRFVTGRSVEEWASGQTNPVAMASVEVVPCNLATSILIAPKGDASSPRPETIKPWGVEVVGAPTPAKALARYREWKPKYTAIIADREPHVVVRGILGEMGAARVRIGEDTQVAAKKLCAALMAAGAYCDVLRNQM